MDIYIIIKVHSLLINPPMARTLSQLVFMTFSMCDIVLSHTEFFYTTTTASEHIHRTHVLCNFVINPEIHGSSSRHIEAYSRGKNWKSKAYYVYFE